MCSHDDTYNEFPAVTIGGPTGDYEVTCPVTSCKWAEYAIDAVVNGDGGTGSIVVSGHNAPIALVYDGSKTLNKDNFAFGVPFRVPATTSYQTNSSYERITHSQKKVFVRIDAAASTSLYVTIRFRVKRLDVVPGPSHTVHPDHMQELNKKRAEAIRERTEMKGEIQKGEGLNARR